MILNMFQVKFAIVLCRLCDRAEVNVNTNDHNLSSIIVFRV